jgi:hypothetical protein
MFLWNLDNFCLLLFELLASLLMLVILISMNFVLIINYFTIFIFVGCFYFSRHYCKIAYLFGLFNFNSFKENEGKVPQPKV